MWPDNRRCFQVYTRPAVSHHGEPAARSDCCQSFIASLVHVRHTGRGAAGGSGRGVNARESRRGKTEGEGGYECNVSYAQKENGEKGFSRDKLLR